MSPTPWATLEDARTAWADASTMSDDELESLLTVATECLMPYARRADLLTLPMPSRLVRACIAQARDIRQAIDRDGDVIGVGDYAILARPLTATVRALMRPQSTPSFGSRRTASRPDPDRETST